MCTCGTFEFKRFETETKVQFELLPVLCALRCPGLQKLRGLCTHSHGSLLRELVSRYDNEHEQHRTHLCSTAPPPHTAPKADTEYPPRASPDRAVLLWLPDRTHACPQKKYYEQEYNTTLAELKQTRAERDSFRDKLNSSAAALTEANAKVRSSTWRFENVLA